MPYGKKMPREVGEKYDSLRELVEPTPIWMDERTIARVGAAAEFLGCSRSELIRNAIRSAAMLQATSRG